jgi:Flp pilus assembly protein TadB
MSREERRNYERMMRNVERGPSLPPAARARAERNAARRAQRQGPQIVAPGGFTRRFVILAVLVALVLGYIAFSVTWPNMPFAAYVGVAVGILTLVIALGFRLLQRRVAGS